MNLPAKGTIVLLPELLALCEEFGLPQLRQRLALDPPLKPFSSDGCSWFPDSWGISVNLYPACLKHDMQYYAGYESSGALESALRMIADCTLVVDALTAGLPSSIAELMFAGVRVGGAARWRLPFSWGYGR